MANEMRKKVVIGVETQNLVEMKQGKPRNTFYEEGWEEMENALCQVATVYKDEPSFGGFAIHCYYSYVMLTRGRNVPMKERPADIYTIASHNTDAKNVTIDGDFSDWNLSEPFPIEYRDNVVYGKGAWFGLDDLSVKVYSMWDKEALYFAFNVRDESVVQEKTGADMWEGDHIELWIDADLYGDYNEAMNSGDDFQFGFSPGNFNNVRPDIIIWTPTVKDELKKTMEIGSQKTKFGYRVEVKVPKEVILHEGVIRARTGQEDTSKIHYTYRLESGPETELKKGFKFGISIDPSDGDNKKIPQESLMSSSTDRVWGDPTTFGILELK